MNCAAAEENTPEPALELTGRVVDAADILSASAETRLLRTLDELEHDTGIQIVVATTPDLKGRDIADYSLELANAWGVGSEETDDGLLLLVAPNERKVRIEVGYGLEASVRDEEAAEIIRGRIIPRFKEADYDRGVIDAVTELVFEVTPVSMKEAA